MKNLNAKDAKQAPSELRKRRKNFFIKIINSLSFALFASFFAYFALINLFSCSKKDNLVEVKIETTATGAKPMAILQPGSHPLWFQLTADGPVHISSIHDAEELHPFIPWPHALHIRFFHEKNNEIIMAVNNYGFIKIAPHEPENEDQLLLYRFGGGEFWKQYTIGGFFEYNGLDTALLYLDDRFLDTDFSFPEPRTWSFNMESNAPFAVTVPALELFPASEGWNADSFRLGNDGFWYYRVSKKNISQPEIQMIRTPDPAQAGISISADDFFNSVPQKPETDASFLPPLPEGFVYTGTAVIGNSIFACWEEQQEYSIGAAGFMIQKKF